MTHMTRSKQTLRCRRNLSPSLAYLLSRRGMAYLFANVPCHVHRARLVLCGDRMHPAISRAICRESGAIHDRAG